MRPAQTPMFTTQQPSSQRPFSRLRTRTRRGQSIVVALLVLLLLGLTGALFVTIIARNLINARHGVRVQTADTYAAAGINYADAQLSSSIDGADWRPPLQFALAANYVPTDAREAARYTASLYNAVTNPNGLQPANANDPDLEYLQAGYTRYNTGAGRYLIRVTYDPVNVNNAAGGAPSTVPAGKYLKVESIGREGVIDPIDPTTYTNNRSTDRTQASQVAYVPIGITDYARFETNPDKRSDIANLGVVSEFYADNTDGGIATPGVFDFKNLGTTGAQPTPPTLQEYPVLTTYGAADAYKVSGTSYVPNPTAGTATTIGTAASGIVAGGGSIHANMPVRFFGTNVIYLNTSGSLAPLFQDTAEVSGDLLLDNYVNANPLKTTSPSATAGQQAALILNPTDLANPTTGTYVAPSNSSGTNGSFNTQGGLVRDGSTQTDANGSPRSITRLEPPLMDAQDSASQIPRYRAIAMNSAPRTYNNGAATYPAGSGQYGYGKDIYINNPEDVQPDSASIGGGSTLTDEWLHGNSSSPTGAAKGGWNGLFYNPPGVSIILGQYFPSTTPGGTGSYGIRLVSSVGETFSTPAGGPNGSTQKDVLYTDLDRVGTTDRDATDPAGASSDKDIIIYLEGNVRVRGILSPNEGTPANPVSIPRHITIVTNGTAYIEGNLMKGDPDSTISVLAHDYVCVNTTQFLAGATIDQVTNGAQGAPPPDSGDLLTLNADQSLLQEFNFGLPSGTKSGSGTSLYISAGPIGGSTTTADFNLTDTTTGTALPQLTETYTTLTRAVYPVTLSGALATDIFQFSAAKDPGTEGSSTTAPDVGLERSAVLPMNIRIEAVLYAQTRSFFVIPGEWFNTTSSDNLTAYLDSFTNNPATFGRPANTDARFPMYGQPIDMKITIDGTVSEARPADIAAQTSWMLKWGWIPQYHGSYNIPQTTGGAGPEGEGSSPLLANQPAVGLQIIYDPQAGYPYNPGGTANGATVAAHYLRSDMFGRPLPFTPKLPVSTGLLYSGQSGEQPLLQ